MATAVEESGAPPPPVIVAAVEEGQTATETTAPQVVSEPQVGAGPGDADVVMVPSDEDSAPPLPTGVVMS
jgi:hypothetical protein